MKSLESSKHLGLLHFGWNFPGFSFGSLRFKSGSCRDRVGLDRGYVSNDSDTIGRGYPVVSFDTSLRLFAKQRQSGG